jgi:uncharacterized RDD family membrane protein YckC
MDYIRSLDLDFNNFKTLPFLDRIPFDLDIPRSLWKYYAAGLSALGTTTIGLGIVIVAVVYHSKIQTLPLPEELAVVTCLIIGIAIKYFYFVFFEYCFKGTIGKMFLDLSVTDARGRRLSLARANRRYWSKLLSTIPLYLGFLPIVWTKKKRALHDRLTGTRISRRK